VVASPAWEESGVTTMVPGDLYYALLNIGADPDEAAKLCNSVPLASAHIIGPPLLALSIRLFVRMLNLERRVEELEAGTPEP
jgi:hypothetical protein